MVPQDKSVFDIERTEQQPAQEKLILGANTEPALSAEQVYAQRLAENQQNGDFSTLTFVP